MIQSSVIPTKATDRLGRSIAAWRDLFSIRSQERGREEKQVPRLADPLASLTDQPSLGMTVFGNVTIFCKAQ